MDGPNKFGYKKMRRKEREEEDEVRVWEGLGMFRRVWEDMGGFGRFWKGLGGFGRVWDDLGRFEGGAGWL